METTMFSDQLLYDVNSLPLTAQRQALDFIEFLKYRYTQNTQHEFHKKKSLKSIEDEPFVGMWKDRSDMKDSSSWVRNLRQNEWG